MRPLSMSIMQLIQPCDPTNTITLVNIIRLWFTLMDTANENGQKQLTPLSQSRIWNALNYPEVLKICILGCDLIKQVVVNQYTITIVAAIGPVKEKFTGSLTPYEIALCQMQLTRVTSTRINMPVTKWDSSVARRLPAPLSS